MASIFDGLTVSSPALGIGGSAGPTPADAPSVSPSVGGAVVSPPSMQVPQPLGVPQPIGVPAMPSVQGATGLMAKVEPEEFARLVKDVGCAVVLYTPQKSGGTQRSTADRYVASIGGIVFVTLTDRTLLLPPGTRVVTCMAVLSDGRPLGHQDNM